MTNSKVLQTARYVSLGASTLIALASGTNYVYSAYAPQLADRLHLSTTQSNIVGTCGNLGMYLSGVPAGILVDSRGPRLSVLIGAASLFLGYYPIYWAYENAEQTTSVGALCLFSILTGVGSCFGFSASIKVAALNFPQNRGTATALPLAAFGLSAFFFSSLSSLFFHGDTSAFLLFLSITTSAIVFVSFFFMRVVPITGSYAAVPTRSDTSDVRRGSKLHRTKSVEEHDREPGTRAPASASASSQPTSPSTGESYRDDRPAETLPTSDEDVSEDTSLISSSSSSVFDDRGMLGNPIDEQSRTFIDEHHHHHLLDIRGWALTRHPEFWSLWIMLGLLSGIGLMTINNIGHSVQALWFHYNPNADPKYVQNRQAIHVSILSLASFTGRLFSGMFSDVVQRKWGYSRIWLILLSSVMFWFAQVAGLTVENPYYLWLVSGLNGFSYGIVFGVMPTIVSEAFGLHGMSQNWGCMTLAPVVSGNIFNLFYGLIYDAHSAASPLPDKHRECTQGLECYHGSYWITLFAATATVPLALGTIWAKRRAAKSAAKVRAVDA